MRGKATSQPLSAPPFYKYSSLMIITFTVMPIEDVSLEDWWLVFLWLMQHRGQILKTYLSFSIINDVNGDYHAGLSYLWKMSCWKRTCWLFAVNIIMTIKKVNDSSLMDAVSCLIRVSQYYHRMSSLHWWGWLKLKCSNVPVFQFTGVPMFQVTMW